MEEFVYRSPMPVPAADLFDWHMRDGALERLTPPWERVRVLGRTGGLEDGTRVTLSVPAGPFRIRWVSRHCEVRAPEGRATEGPAAGIDSTAGRPTEDHASAPAGSYQFKDEQIAGPFNYWVHTHLMLPDGAGSILEDRIQYAPPFGAFGRALASRALRDRLRRLFRYRHETLRGDLAEHVRYAGRPRLRIAITGATGLIASALVPFLTTGGHEVVRLVRRPPRGPHEAQWSIERGLHDPARIGRLDACLHLAGVNIAGARWTAAHKAAVRESRVKGTAALAEALARLDPPPPALLCASALGFYGTQPGDLYEESDPGTGFLSEVCQAWEAAAAPAARAGIRVVHLRTGIVLTPAGGALAPLLLQFRLGGGGRLGSGKQPMSWIGIDDVVGAWHHALQHATLWGPVNVTAPNPVTNEEFAKTLGRVIARPAILPAPAFALRLAVGEMADPLLLEGSRVLPERLLMSGYEFRHTQLEAALRHVLGRHDPQERQDR